MRLHRSLFSAMRFVAFVLVLAMAMSCSGGGGGGGNPTPPPTTGSLSLSVTGLPGTVPASIAITGPSSFNQNASGSTTIQNLNPGSYTINTSNVVSGNSTYQGSPATQATTVIAGQTVVATVTYAPQAIFVTVNPSSASLSVGGTQTFTASVSNSTNQTVIWSVDGTASGSITAAGAFTAPASAGTFTVRATSAADSTKSGTASVNVIAPTIVVSITPPTPGVLTNGAIALSASVSGTSNQAVTWDLPGGVASGTLTVAGAANVIYTAPATTGTFQVRATSVADATKSATVTVTVTQGSGFRLSGPARIAPSASSQFTALFNDTSVVANWTLEGAANGCVISPSGLFTAGATNATVTVRGTDATVPSRTGTALVTVASQVTLTIVGPTNPTLSNADMVTFNSVVSPTGVTPEVNWTTGSGASGTTIPVDYFRGYLPPSAPGIYTITATSFADPNVSASFQATVTTPAGPAFIATSGDPSTPRYEHSTAMLPDGRVVILGGQQHRGAYSPLTTSDVFNPVSGTFTSGPELLVPRFESEAIAIDANRVLVTGGYEEYDLARNTGEILILGTGSVATTNPMSARRLLHQMVKLTTGPNAGKIAVMGGFNGPIPYGRPTWQATASVDIFDGATNTFTPLPGSMKTPRGLFTATPLLNGNILIVGGYDANSSSFLASSEIFDPVAGTFTFTGTLSRSRTGHTATRLADGKVLISGGATDAVDGATAELYNPATGLFESVNGAMAVPRRFHAAALLDDGRVAIFGGESQDNWVRGTAEVFDPIAKTFSPFGRMSIPRSHATANLLITGPRSGKVLVFGGGAENKVAGAAELTP